MSYSGGDGQTLGIVLTPKHITELFCDLVDLKPLMWFVIHAVALEGFDCCNAGYA